MKKKNIFWAGIAVALVAAAATALLVVRRNTEVPPRRAPQVPINNPGEQSDFTTSATESEVG